MLSLCYQFAARAALRLSSPWLDVCELAVKEYTEKVYDVIFSTTLISDACKRVAQKFAFDPVKEWMTGLVWDGTPRLATFLHQTLGAEANDYHAAIFTKWLCAGVARTYHPGHKFDNMLVLEDDEGKGKSRLLRALANGWFTDDFSFGLSSKEVVEQAKGSLIIEVAEMSTRSSADVEHIKAFLSRGEERVRMAYARNTGYFPRRWIIGGSTNESAYLKSETGNRRFWCVRGDGREINVDAVKQIVPQLWAEAKDRYLNHAEPLYLEDKTVLAFAVEQQAARVEIDAWAPMIEAWLDGKNADDFDKDDETDKRKYEVIPAQLWKKAIKGSLDRYTQRDARRLNSIMRRMPGWEERTKIRLGGIYPPARGFSRPKPKAE